MKGEVRKRTGNHTKKPYLSTLIKRGEKVTGAIPPGRGTFSYDGLACALGSAYVALTGKTAAEYRSTSFDGVYQRLCSASYKSLLDLSVPVPTTLREKSVGDVIVHLYDVSRWSHTEIANWVEKVEKNLRDKTRRR